MKPRKIVLWLHLMAGVWAGSVVLMMSVTGVLLAFERQIVAFAERHARMVPPPTSGASRLSLEALVAKAREAVPEGVPAGVTLRADPTAPVFVSFGREQTIFIDPYTGAVLGEGATTLRSFFHAVTDWHRWLGMHGDSRQIGRAITGTCNAAFVGLVVTGFYLWWARRWTRVALRTVTIPSLKLRGKPRNWNWHNAVGFWCAPALLFIALTGLVMSYQWAGNLLYTLTGSEPPPQPQRPPESRPAPSKMGRSGSAPATAGTPPEGRTGEAGEARSIPLTASLDALFAAAATQAPHWRLINMRLLQPGATPMTVMIEEADSPHLYPRSTLTLNTATAAVLKWEPYEGYNLGRTIRFWVRPVHTGEAGGLIGQVIAALASAGGVVLVYTGLALAWRRWWQFVRRHRGAGRREHEDAAGQDIEREDTRRVGGEAALIAFTKEASGSVPPSPDGPPMDETAVIPLLG